MIASAACRWFRKNGCRRWNSRRPVVLVLVLVLALALPATSHGRERSAGFNNAPIEAGGKQVDSDGNCTHIKGHTWK